MKYTAKIVPNKILFKYCGILRYITILASNTQCKKNPILRHIFTIYINPGNLLFNSLA